MRAKLAFLRIKAALAFKTIVWILRQWRYALVALIVSWLFFELVYWMFNLSILGFILSSGSLSLLDKISVLMSPFASVANTNGVVSVGLMIGLAIIQGISVAVLAYTVIHQRKLEAGIIGGGSIIGLMAIIGLGCPACGTSLVTPIVAIFISGSAVAVSESISRVALPIALLIGLYGLYAIGLKATNAKAATLSRQSEDQ